MHTHKLCHGAAGRVIHFHALHDVAGILLAHLRMTFVFVFPVFKLVADRLSHVVDQHGPAQHRCRLDFLHRLNSVLPGTQAVVRVALLHLH